MLGGASTGACISGGRQGYGLHSSCICALLANHGAMFGSTGARFIDHGNQRRAMHCHIATCTRTKSCYLSVLRANRREQVPIVCSVQLSFFLSQTRYNTNPIVWASWDFLLLYFFPVIASTIPLTWLYVPVHFVVFTPVSDFLGSAPVLQFHILGSRIRAVANLHTCLDS